MKSCGAQHHNTSAWLHFTRISLSVSWWNHWAQVVRHVFRGVHQQEKTEEHKRHPLTTVTPCTPCDLEPGTTKKDQLVLLFTRQNEIARLFSIKRSCSQKTLLAENACRMLAQGQTWEQKAWLTRTFHPQKCFPSDKSSDIFSPGKTLCLSVLCEVLSSVEAVVSVVLCTGSWPLNNWCYTWQLNK